MNIEPGDREKMKRFIGPPLYESFLNFYNMTPDEAEEAVRLYRVFYEKEGVFNAPLYDGIRELLQNLRSRGCRMMVVTSKPADLASIVVKHNGIDEYFDAVVGPTRAEKHSDKTVLIEKALSIIADSADAVPEEAELRKSVLMVGDRHYDIDAAVKCGIDSVGVLFGYGSETELREAGATYIAARAEDISHI